MDLGEEGIGIEGAVQLDQQSSRPRVPVSASAISRRVGYPPLPGSLNDQRIRFGSACM
jgi:hypothetical protein